MKQVCLLYPFADRSKTNPQKCWHVYTSKDWRLTGQVMFLKGKAFTRTRFVITAPNWDHEHCEFCWAKFTETASPKTLNDGYVDDDGSWVCEKCFADFCVKFEWKVR